MSALPNPFVFDEERIGRSHNLDSIHINSIQAILRMQEISDRSLIVASKDQVWCDLAGEAAILNLKNGVYYGLDPIGARVWQLIQQPVTVDSLCQAVEAEYDVDPQRCRDDLKSLLKELAANELIELREDSKTQ